MKLIIISGRSGSGKTTCLHVLEDIGYYCVDNIPASLLAALSTRLSADNLQLDQVAVSIDARNISEDLKQFPEIYDTLQTSAIATPATAVAVAKAPKTRPAKSWTAVRTVNPVKPVFCSIIRRVPDGYW